MSLIIKCFLLLNVDKGILSYDNCKKFESIEELIIGNAEYEKCYTIFNRRINKAIDYKMDKSSLIKLKFNLKDFKQYKYS